MAEIVAFPTECAPFAEGEAEEDSSTDAFLFEEGLELLADFRAIADRDVRAHLRALVKALACSGARSPI